jgi:hypothetical protein
MNLAISSLKESQSECSINTGLDYKNRSKNTLKPMNQEIGKNIYYCQYLSILKFF